MTLKSPIARILAGLLMLVIGLLVGWLVTPLLFEESPVVRLAGLAVFMPGAVLVLLSLPTAFGGEK